MLLTPFSSFAADHPSGAAIWQYLENEREYAEGAGVYHFTSGGPGFSGVVHPVIMSFSHTYREGEEYQDLTISFPVSSNWGVEVIEHSYQFKIVGNELFQADTKVGEIVSDRWVDIDWAIRFASATADGDAWRKLDITFQRGKFSASLEEENGASSRRGEFEFLFGEDTGSDP